MAPELIEPIVSTISAVQPMIDMNGFQITWTVSPEVQNVCRTIGFFAALVWLAWVGAQVLFPKQRNMLMQGGGGKVWQFLGAAVFIVILMDVNMVPTILNWSLQALVSFFNMLFPNI